MKYFIFVIYAMGLVVSYWVGAQQGAEQTDLNWHASQSTKTISKVVQIEAGHCNGVASSLNSELSQLIIGYGRYLETGFKWPPWPFNYERSIDSFYSKAVKYRLDNPYILEGKEMNPYLFNSYEELPNDMDERTKKKFVKEIAYYRNAIEHVSKNIK